ncbi:type II toxin-antitoxin system RelB/DinJ family antitoxin [Microbacterium sp.]|uniref:type II toxin-antitoxin system RelB/DinJ family antitoxin n=1 Tax=Microbacterium sp. TaxID=51671 RepID=UPI003C78610C
MGTTTLNIRMDAELKRDVDEVARSLGLTSAAAFNVFARQFVARRGFPFAVVAATPTERQFGEEMDARFAAMRAGAATEHELVDDE